ncbi:translation initiation factor IF-3, mitochondrial [Platysternon megacephalum]|uniref:Translation initiation factor IF-3, mitochondrial n=1 Tax=Platysternon megacephalum TaxID=55544 RepID=A0A4D9EWR5_9SAUR|nr:translation initiation factor IF-3, mitochondrial [Platysternon megacephalum]
MEVILCLIAHGGKILHLIWAVLLVPCALVTPTWPPKTYFHGTELKALQEEEDGTSWTEIGEQLALRCGASESFHSNSSVASYSKEQTRSKLIAPTR